MVYSIEELTAIVKDIVADYPDKRVILIGSYAKNTATDKSDVDLVLDGDDLSEAYWDVLFALEDRLKISVDVMTMRGINSSVIKDSMLEGSITLYED